MFNYKDKNPIITINKIRNILEKLGIVTIENWKFNLDNIFSVRLTIPKVNPKIGTNGKGKTIQLALASAYGELIERLQNQLLYPIYRYYYFDKYLREHMGFCFAPDEKWMAESEIMNNIPRNILNNFYLSNENVNRADFKCPDFMKSDNGLVSVPYYDLNSDSILYFPAMFSYYLYGSNGMCSGNTPEEAIVQGICEIIERYAILKVLRDKINPPTITRNILKKYFHEQYKIIKDIENKTNYEIIVKDCSLSIGLPVLAIILLNRKKIAYFVKFGSHPDLRIALERAIFESFQLRDLYDFKRFVNFEVLIDETIITENRNYRNICTNGEGVYPIELFGNNFSYSISSETFQRKFSSNKDCLRFLISLINKMKWNILIRDVSFLDFPSFHIIIPGVSEINHFSNDEYELLDRQFHVFKILRNDNWFSKKNLNYIINFMEKENSLGFRKNLADIVQLPFNNNSILSKISYDIFLAIAYYSIENLKKSRYYINKSLYNNELHNSNNIELLSYFKCARDYVGFLMIDYKIKDAKNILEKLYKKETIKKVFQDFDQPTNLLNNIEKLKCPDCKNCKYSLTCSYDKIREIHKRLKSLLAKNIIDQNKLKSIFNSL